MDGHSLKLGLTYIRNNAICKVFREAEYIEKLGSGFITLFKSYEKRGLRPPQVIEGENFIKCILPRPLFSDKPTKTDEDTKKIMDLFEVAEEISIFDVMKSLCLSRPTAGRRIVELVNQGFLESVGQGRTTRYRKVI